MVLSRGDKDEAWDEFLAATPGGHHAQTSLWAQVKLSLGWEALRIIVLQGDRIVAGVQVSMRRLAPAVWLGVVSKGPVVTANDPGLQALLIDHLIAATKQHSIQVLVVQPPNNAFTLPKVLQEKGFRPTTLEVAPTATVQIDLGQDADAILKGMKKKTRRYIRHGLRIGVIGREGTDGELATFYRLLKATSARTDWPVYAETYYAEILRVFSSRGHVKLLFAEYGGAPVSSQLLIAFGDTVIAKNSGWSGQFRGLGINNVLEWASIQWAKRQGYRYYDLEGITTKTAQSALKGLGANAADPWCYYKLQYGGQVRFFPQAHGPHPQPVGVLGRRCAFRTREAADRQEHPQQDALALRGKTRALVS